MNKSMLAGVGIAWLSALALSAVASGSLFSPEPQFAECAGQQAGDRDHQDAALRSAAQRHRRPTASRCRTEHTRSWAPWSVAALGAVGHQFGGGSGRRCHRRRLLPGLCRKSGAGNMQAGDTYTTTGAALQDGAGEQHPHHRL